MITTITVGIIGLFVGIGMGRLGNNKTPKDPYAKYTDLNSDECLCVNCNDKQTQHGVNKWGNRCWAYVSKKSDEESHNMALAKTRFRPMTKEQFMTWQLGLDNEPNKKVE